MGALVSSRVRSRVVTAAAKEQNSALEARFVRRRRGARLRCAAGLEVRTGGDAVATAAIGLPRRARRGEGLESTPRSGGRETSGLAQRIALPSLAELRAEVVDRYGAARGWVDAIIQPRDTRDVLIRLLGFVSRPAPTGARFHMGVVQT